LQELISVEHLPLLDYRCFVLVAVVPGTHRRRECAQGALLDGCVRSLGSSTPQAQRLGTCIHLLVYVRDGQHAGCAGNPGKDDKHLLDSFAPQLEPGSRNPILPTLQR